MRCAVLLWAVVGLEVVTVRASGGARSVVRTQIKSGADPAGPAEPAGRSSSSWASWLSPSAWARSTVSGVGGLTWKLGGRWGFSWIVSILERLGWSCADQQGWLNYWLSGYEGWLGQEPGFTDWLHPEICTIKALTAEEAELQFRATAGRLDDDPEDECEEPPCAIDRDWLESLIIGHLRWLRSLEEEAASFGDVLDTKPAAEAMREVLEDPRVRRLAQDPAVLVFVREWGADAGLGVDVDYELEPGQTPTTPDEDWSNGSDLLPGEPVSRESPRGRDRTPISRQDTDLSPGGSPIVNRESPRGRDRTPISRQDTDSSPRGSPIVGRESPRDATQGLVVRDEDTPADGPKPIVDTQSPTRREHSPRSQSPARSQSLARHASQENHGEPSARQPLSPSVTNGDEPESPTIVDDSIDELEAELADLHGADAEKVLKAQGWEMVEGEDPADGPEATGIVARRAHFFTSLAGALKKRKECEVGRGPCMATFKQRGVRKLVCTAYNTATNVCPCNTRYNDGTQDQGRGACCGANCPTMRIMQGDYRTD